VGWKLEQIMVFFCDLCVPELGLAVLAFPTVGHKKFANPACAPGFVFPLVPSSWSMVAVTNHLIT
jgi:hypothetical protein